MTQRLIVMALGGVLALSLVSCQDQHVALPAQGPVASRELLGCLVWPLSRGNPRAQPITQRNRLSGLCGQL
jgi:hypothetical protein